jgi:pre-mRNA-splicing factor CWC26
MSTSKKAYLAERYMSGAKADAILARTTTKKKKRKAGTPNSNPTASGSSGFIVDDDVSWVPPPKDDEEEEDLEDALVVKDRSFKRRKVEDVSSAGAATKPGGGGGWTTIREGADDGTQREDGSPPPAADELPQIAGVVEDAPSAISGGILTKAQLRKKLGPKSRERGKGAEDEEESARQQETVYRDGSGRKIDMKAEKAEAARRKREAEEKEARKMEWGKGVVQREEKERERALMEKERDRGFARRADDAELNEEQKAKELWNDPAAAFLMVCLFSNWSLSVQTSHGTHRRNGAKARGDRNTQVRRLRRTDSGSNQDIGGTESTEATGSNENTFNVRMSENDRELKAIRGALTTCRTAFCRIYIYVCVGALQQGFSTRVLSRNSKGERGEEKEDTHTGLSTAEKSREMLRRESRIN